MSEPKSPETTTPEAETLPTPDRTREVLQEKLQQHPVLTFSRTTDRGEAKALIAESGEYYYVIQSNPHRETAFFEAAIVPKNNQGAEGWITVSERTDRLTFMHSFGEEQDLSSALRGIEAADPAVLTPNSVQVLIAHLGK